jgi:hypothetical protein
VFFLSVRGRNEKIKEKKIKEITTMDRTKRKRDSEICHGCGRRPDCQGCMEYCAFVDGVQDKDYNAQLKTHDVQHMLRQVRADLEKEMGEYNPDQPITAIQLVNTLFEAAAVLTAMGRRSGAVKDDDKTKLGALNQHAWDGMAMINGYADGDDAVTQSSHTSTDRETTP